MSHPDLDRFEHLYSLADKLMGEANGDDLAEVARILALNLAQYQAKHGELSAEAYLSLATEDNLTPELAKALADGMENLVGVLVNLAEQGGSQQDETTH